jgi:GNAT superfamily N-acetyltransferase
MSETVNIHRLLDSGPTREIERGIDAIFFESSNTKSFESDPSRAAFRERWLGRYLQHDPQFGFLALRPSGEVAGYLVGAIEDPALAPRFADIELFTMLREQTRKFPAHLHVNIAPEFRNRGIGGRLVDRFVADAKAHGSPGVHVVTGAGSPNISFYNRNGFAEIARAGASGQLLFLGRPL